VRGCKYATFMKQIGSLKNSAAAFADIVFDAPDVAGGD
jgi:hypothetical protein